MMEFMYFVYCMNVLHIYEYKLNILCIPYVHTVETFQGGETEQAMVTHISYKAE